MKGESSRLGLGNARIFFFSFFSLRRAFSFFSFFSLRRAFSFFFPQEANKCFSFIIIYYFARYSCIACVIAPMLARSPRSFLNYDSKCFLGFFKNNSNEKMFAPHAVDIAVIISSLIASPCFTSSQVVHWSAEIQTKVNSRSLSHFAFLQNSLKNGH